MKVCFLISVLCALAAHILCTSVELAFGCLAAALCNLRNTEWSTRAAITNTMNDLTVLLIFRGVCKSHLFVKLVYVIVGGARHVAQHPTIDTNFTSQELKDLLCLVSLVKLP